MKIRPILNNITFNRVCYLEQKLHKNAATILEDAISVLLHAYAIQSGETWEVVEHKANSYDWRLHYEQ